MHRNSLLQYLKEYSPKNSEEKSKQQRMIQFINGHTDCFERSCKVGHITGSTFLLNPDKSKILLTHHKKLNQWLQLGGHSDGETDTLQVALKEAKEESGINSIQILSKDIFDLDIHTIPERKGEPEHLHYDIRFLFQAKSEDFQVSEESNQLRWFSFEEALEQDLDESLTKMILKWLHQAR